MWDTLLSSRTHCVDGPDLHLPHLAAHIFHTYPVTSALKFGKVVFCEVALCPGMQWGRISSKHWDLWFVPLAGTHYTESECCFHVVFHLSWIWAESWSTKEGKSKQVPKARERAQSIQGCTWLWHSSIPRRGWEILFFHSKFRKIQPQALDLVLGWFV